MSETILTVTLCVIAVLAVLLSTVLSIIFLAPKPEKTGESGSTQKPVYWWLRIIALFLLAGLLLNCHLFILALLGYLKAR